MLLLLLAVVMAALMPSLAPENKLQVKLLMGAAAAAMDPAAENSTPSLLAPRQGLVTNAGPLTTAVGTGQGLHVATGWEGPTNALQQYHTT
jgi:hypothetical protein